LKILHTVEFYYPSVGGMQEVVKQLSERLVRLGHEVTVVTTRLPHRKNYLVNGVKIVEFNISGNFASGMRGEVALYQRFILDSSFDVITNFAAQQWTTDAMITLLDQIPAVKIFVPTGFSGLFFPKYQKYFELMKQWLKQYDMNVFSSNDYRDVNFARENDVAQIMVIPNGAGEDDYLTTDVMDIRKKLGISETDFFILQVGSHTGVKGHAEAIRIFNKAKITNATFLITGSVYSRRCAIACKLKEVLFNSWVHRKKDRKKLIVTYLSDEEIRAAYRTANLFLFPSNIECSPLVLFECMATRTPFLTTDVGNAVEIIEWSGGGLLLPTLRDQNGRSRAEVTGSSSMLEELWANPDRCEVLANMGHRAWQERFTWGKITHQYEVLYLMLLQKLTS